MKELLAISNGALIFDSARDQVVDLISIDEEVRGQRYAKMGYVNDRGETWSYFIALYPKNDWDGRMQVLA
jgi:hypothetical protein